MDNLDQLDKYIKWCLIHLNRVNSSVLEIGLDISKSKKDAEGIRDLLSGIRQKLNTQNEE